MIYDLIIIGGGPAGITAGIYGARQKLKTLLVTSLFGGQMTKKAVMINNYPGFEEISGADLSKRFEDHLKKQDVDIENDNVLKIEKNNSLFSVVTDNKSFQGRSVIISTGASPKHLGVSGEKEFLGKGLSYCVVCDGYFFSDKKVVIVGGGNTGFEAAQFLSKIAKEIFILEYNDNIPADKVNQEIVKKDKKVKVITSVEVKEIKGDDFVRSIVYNDRKTGETQLLEVDGVFVQIGLKTDFPSMDNLIDTNSKNEIIFNPATNQTKTPGLFVAGDVGLGRFKQIVISCGEGAKAALSAFAYLKLNSLNDR